MAGDIEAPARADAPPANERRKRRHLGVILALASLAAISIFTSFSHVHGRVHEPIHQRVDFLGADIEARFGVASAEACQEVLPNRAPSVRAPCPRGRRSGEPTRVRSERRRARSTPRASRSRT